MREVDRITPAEDIAIELRSNAAFEQLVVSTLIVAVGSMALRLLIEAILFMLEGGGLIAAFRIGIVPSLIYGFVIFLGGFICAGAIGFPVWRRLERQERFASWPFYLCGGLICLASLLFLPANTAQEVLFRLVPAILIPLLFLRRVEALQQAAARANAPTQATGSSGDASDSNVWRLH